MKHFIKLASVLLCLAMLLTICSLSGCGNKPGENDDETTEDPNVTVRNRLALALSPADAPFAYYNEDKIVGAAIDVIASLSDGVNMDLELKDIPVDSLISGLLSEHYTAIFGCFNITDDETLKKLSISDPIIIDQERVLVKADSAIAAPADLTGKKVGVRKGMPGEAIAKEKLDADSVVVYDTYSAAIAAINAGEVEAVIIDNASAAKALAADAGLKLLAADFSYKEYVICALSNRSSLIDNLNIELFTLQTNMQYAGIINGYLSDPTQAE